MTKLYKKSELAFALAWIGVYCAVQSLSILLDDLIGVAQSAGAALCLLQAAVLFAFLKKNGLLRRYGLCRPCVPARRFLYYVPLVVLSTGNLWNGIAVRAPFTELLCHIALMLAVGFNEELIFRGLLFRALAKDGRRMAIVVSSVTFGLGHIVNLFNGSGMALAANLSQVVGAVAFGFLFVILYDRSASLLPCILAHAANNIFIAFASEAGLTPERRMAFRAAQLLIIAGYLLVLVRRLSQIREADGA